MTDFSEDFPTDKGTTIVSECMEDDSCVTVCFYAVGDDEYEEPIEDIHISLEHAANVAGSIMRIAKKMEQRKRDEK